jgi:hypothetical protein
MPDIRAAVREIDPADGGNEQRSAGKGGHEHRAKPRLPHRLGDHVCHGTHRYGHTPEDEGHTRRSQSAAVHLQSRNVGCERLSHVANDGNDGHRFASEGIVELDPATHGFTSPEKLHGQRPVYGDHRACRMHLVRREIPACNHRDTHRTEVPGSDDVRADPERFSDGGPTNGAGCSS